MYTVLYLWPRHLCGHFCAPVMRIIESNPPAEWRLALAAAFGHPEFHSCAIHSGDIRCIYSTYTHAPICAYVEQLGAHLLFVFLHAFFSARNSSGLGSIMLELATDFLSGRLDPSIRCIEMVSWRGRWLISIIVLCECVHTMFCVCSIWMEFRHVWCTHTVTTHVETSTEWQSRN